MKFGLSKSSQICRLLLPTASFVAGKKSLFVVDKHATSIILWKMLRLNCIAQSYDWGKPGASSAVALLKVSFQSALI